MIVDILVKQVDIEHLKVQKEVLFNMIIDIEDRYDRKDLYGIVSLLEHMIDVAEGTVDGKEASNA